MDKNIQIPLKTDEDLCSILSENPIFQIPISTQPSNIENKEKKEIKEANDEKSKSIVKFKKEDKESSSSDSKQETSSKIAQSIDENEEIVLNNSIIICFDLSIAGIIIDVYLFIFALL